MGFKEDLEQICGNFRNEVLVVLIHADERHARLRQDRTCADLRFHIRFPERVIEKAVERMITRATEASEVFVTAGIAAVMNQFNGGDPATTE